MSAVTNKSELPAGWSEERTVAGHNTYKKYVDEWNDWTKQMDRIEKEICEPYYRMALIPPTPRFARWQVQKTVTSLVTISSWSTDEPYPVERPIYERVLLSRKESEGIVADVSKLSSFIFNVNMKVEYPETGIQDFRDIRVYSLN